MEYWTYLVAFHLSSLVVDLYTVHPVETVISLSQRNNYNRNVTNTCVSLNFLKLNLSINMDNLSNEEKLVNESLKFPISYI